MSGTEPSDFEVTDLALFSSLEDLMSNGGGTRLTESALARTLFEYGRAMILAPMGGGKTTILDRVSRSLLPNYASTVHSIPALLATRQPVDKSSEIRTWLQDASRRPYGSRLLLGLDGLDEVTPSDAQLVLDGIEWITRKDPQLAVVVTDRVTRRAVRDERWALFGVAQRAAGGASPTWAELPYFQSRSPIGATRAESIRLATLGSWPSLKGHFQAVADGAYSWFEQKDSTATLREFVPQFLGDGLTEELREADLLRERDGVLFFQHPLIHSYLAAEHVRSRPELWNGQTWDALTLDGATFTGLGMLLEAVDDDQVGSLVRAVDKWNYLASASLLAEDAGGGGRRRVDDGLRAALLLLLGHRRLASSRTTSVLAADHLRLQVGDELASRILAVDDRPSLVQIALDLPSFNDWWEEWRTLFTETDARNLVPALAHGDHLIAWTASNVLSGMTLPSGVEATVMKLTSEPSSADTRWRALHALGSSRSPCVAEVCLNSFSRDSDEWPRYGALRVFLQVVAHLGDAEARRRLCAQLADAAIEIRGVARWEREIERAAEFRDAPPDWPTSFGRVVAALQAISRDLDEEDRWRAAMAVLQVDTFDPFAVAFRPMPAESEA